MSQTDCLQRYQLLIEAKLDEVLPLATQAPVALHEAMRYSVFSGGKRFRPGLTLASCEAAGGRFEDALLPALAVELVHCYSLVHDDLPALDNDDMRRGKPSCHRQYGEALAILTGDALLTQAFGVLSQMTSGKRVAEILLELSTAAGSCGMIGGQVVDLEVANETPDLPKLDFINIHKTGKLIRASAVCGALAADAGEETLHRIMRYGEYLGLAFQSVDDLLDGDGLLRIQSAMDVRANVRDLIANAKREIKPLGRRAQDLLQIADFLLERVPGEGKVELDS